MFGHILLEKIWVFKDIVMMENPKELQEFLFLEVMKKSNITDCAVVVTRYFGGILLGTGGLTRAYTKGASIALKAAGIVEKVKGVKIKFTIDYDLLGKIQYICGQNIGILKIQNIQIK